MGFTDFIVKLFETKGATQAGGLAIAGAVSGAAQPIAQATVNEAKALLKFKTLGFFFIAILVLVEHTVFNSQSFIFHGYYQLVILAIVGMMYVLPAKGQEKIDNARTVFLVFLLQVAILFGFSLYNADVGYIETSLLFNASFLLGSLETVIVLFITGWLIASGLAATGGNAIRNAISMLKPIAAGMLVCIGMLALSAGLEFFLNTAVLDSIGIIRSLVGLQILATFTVSSLWFFYGLINASQESFLVRIAWICYVVLLVGAFVHGLYTVTNITDNQSGNVDVNYISMGQSFLEYSTGVYGQARNGTLTFFVEQENQLNRIIDPTFESRVEQQQGLQNVGVFLETPQATQPNFAEGRDVILLANVVAKTTNEPFNVNVGCYMEQKGQRVLEGTVTNNQFVVSSENFRTLRCIFDGNKIRPGKFDIVLYANYTSVTSAYTRRYYVGETRLEQISQQGQDPLDVFAIPQSERSSVSVYTPGPARLIVGTLLQVQGVPDTPSPESIIDIWVRLEQAADYQGQLTKLNELTFSLPQGIDLVGPDACIYDVEEISLQTCQQACVGGDTSCLNDCAAYTTYKVTEELELPLSLNCQLLPQSARTLLDNNPLAIKSYRAIADYVFTTQRSVSINILPTDELQEDAPTFSDIPIRATFRADAQQNFERNKQTITDALYVENRGRLLDRFNYNNVDETIKYLTQGMIVQFGEQTNYNPAFCIEGYPIAGFLGLNAAEAFNATRCPENVDTTELGNQQIAQVTQSLRQFKNQCDTADCIVGKHYCGSAFVPGDYNSCTLVNCVWCQDVFVPNTLTYAQSMYDHVNEVTNE